MAQSSSLLGYSLTLPELPKHHLPRPQLVKWFADRFLPERKVILLEGSDGSGKTTLMAEFAHQFPDRAFTFFVASDYWGSSPRWFLMEMCAQMHQAIGTEPLEDLDQLPDSRLMTRFATLYRRVGERARVEQVPFFFVVDGLDWVKDDYGQLSIVDLLPTDLPRNVYLLISSSRQHRFNFQYSRESVMPFAPSETEAYLQDLQLTKEQLRIVHDISGGTPGYLAQIRRGLHAGDVIDDYVAQLPRSLAELLAHEWEGASIEDDIVVRILAILAYSTARVGLRELSQIVEASEEDVQEMVAQVPMIVVLDNPERTVKFVTDTHHKYAIQRLAAHRLDAMELLISHYQRDPFSRSALYELPVLYKETESYEALRQLISADYLVQILRDGSPELSLIRRNAQLVADAALASQDWNTLAEFAVIGSAISTVTRGATAAAEIEALLTLGDYDQALKISYNSILLEDRLEMLGMCARYMKQEGIPFPTDLLGELAHLVSAVTPTGISHERAIEIAADLFYVNPQSAMELVDKVSDTAGHGSAMDEILAVLSLRLSEKEDFASQLGEHISDERIRDFVRASSRIVGKLDADQALQEAREIGDTSGRLFFLRSWCNANRENCGALAVVREATEIMTASDDYSTSMRELRQFAEPLPACADDKSVQEVVGRFDILKNTAIREPFEELVRLELLLAEAELRGNSEDGESRLINVYLSLNDLPEDQLDALCYSIVRLLLSLPKFPPGLLTSEELVNELLINLQTLLEQSAEHWLLTQRLIHVLTSYEPNLAVKVAEGLNISIRRDTAYLQILRAYIRTQSEPDLSFIETIIQRISDPARRDVAFTLALDLLSHTGNAPHAELVRDWASILARIEEMRSNENKCYAYAFGLRLLAASAQSQLVDEVLERLREAWGAIDANWKQVDVGYSLVIILAEDQPDFARELLSDTKRLKTTTPLADGTFAELYVHTIRLAIRCFRDLLKEEDVTAALKPLLDAIYSVSSIQTRIELLSDLALVHHYAGRQQGFEEIMRQALKELDNCHGEAHARAVQYMAPSIFVYERSLLQGEIDELPSAERNDALSRIVTYQLTEGALDEPVSLDRLNRYVDFATALRVTELIAVMDHDAAIYQHVDWLVDALIEFKKGGGEQCRLQERQALTIAERLRQIIETKLPDPNNIQHEGYRIASLACLARLKASIEFPKAYAAWDKTVPTWDAIADGASNIPNAADRALVLAWVGAKAYRNNGPLGKRLLDEAKNAVYTIPNALDRSDRFYAIAEAWKSVDAREYAELFLREALQLVELQTWDPTRDMLAGKILHLAHSIAPEFAVTLTSSVTNPLIKDRAQRELAARELQQRPAGIPEHQSAEEGHRLLGQVARGMVEDFRLGRGYAQSADVVGKWLHFMVSADFWDAYVVSAWAVENSLAQTAKLRSPSLKPLYYNYIDALHLVFRIGQKLIQSEDNTYLLQAPGFLDSTLFFYPDRPGSATDYVHTWLAHRTTDYVTFYDPYFSVSEMAFLKSVPADTTVVIITSWKGQKGISPNDSVIEDRFREGWQHISEQVAPNTHVYVVGITAGGDSPMHNRYILTAGAGIELSTSLNGLDTKDTTIRSLTPDEAQVREREFVEPIILGYKRAHKNEELLVRAFTL